MLHDTLHLGLLQLGRAARAADSAQAPLTVGHPPNLTWLMTVVVVMVLVIGAIAWGFRKVVAGSLKARASQRDLAVLDVLPLGGKRQLAVVRCFDRTFALGLGEKDVSLVAELDHQAVEIDRETAQGERGAAFRKRLEAARDRLLGSSPPALTPEAAAASIPTGEVDVPRPGSEREFVA